ncbi:MAG: flagellar motor switch protein FliN [Nitrospira sp.]|nr:flagellar motor switch protein FliN [Nitrospira sp.]MDR4465415.1 flagellar motor switch protein FliN [Nitrospira sp.]
MAESEPLMRAEPQTEGKASPQPASFPPVQGGETGGGQKNMDFLLDIPMSVAVYVGSAKMAIRDLLQLAQGSVIELDKLAGEPMEVMVNNKLVARGEVVVVNEKFGIRLTDVVSAAERVQQLR